MHNGVGAYVVGLAVAWLGFAGAGVIGAASVIAEQRARTEASDASAAVVTVMQHSVMAMSAGLLLPLEFFVRCGVLRDPLPLHEYSTVAPVLVLLIVGLILIINSVVLLPPWRPPLATQGVRLLLAVAWLFALILCGLFGAGV